MFKKYILTLSVILSFGLLGEAQADMHGDEASGFSGSFELKYKGDLGDLGNVDGFTTRVRAGWAGEVNDMVMWKLGLSSDIEKRFGGYELNIMYLEQAYVKYMPMDGLSVKAGKFGWHPSFAKTGVLYDDDLYAEGVVAKYKYDAYWAKVAVVNLTDEYSGPFSSGAVVKAMVGTKQNVAGLSVKAKVGSMYDGLFGGNGLALATAGVHVGVPHLGIPVSVSGNYITDVSDPLTNDTYTVGVNVNESNAVNNVSVGVNYYNINNGTWSLDVVDTDYVKTNSDTTGVAARVQYNAWENSNLVVKYAYSLDGTAYDPNNIVGELTFNF